MPTVREIAARQRAGIVAQDRATAKKLIDAYGEVWQRIRIDLAALSAQIEHARELGGEIPVSWLYREERLATILNQIKRQVDGFASYTQDTTAQAMRLAAHQAEQDALAAMAVGMPAGIAYTFDRLPAGAIQKVILSGRLETYVRGFSAEATRAARHAIITGVAAGYSPRQTAIAVRDSLGGPLWKSLRLARTETMVAYRASGLDTYRENSNVVEGWRWLAGASACPICAQEDGGEHSLDEDMTSHPNCECTQVPITRSWPSILAMAGGESGDFSDEG